MGDLAQMYNVPVPILEAMNPHIQNPNVLTQGSITYIPRLEAVPSYQGYTR